MRSPRDGSRAARHGSSRCSRAPSPCGTGAARSSTTGSCWRRGGRRRASDSSRIIRISARSWRSPTRGSTPSPPRPGGCCGTRMAQSEAWGRSPVAAWSSAASPRARPRSRRCSRRSGLSRAASSSGFLRSRCGRHDTLCNNSMFSLTNLIPREVRFFDYFEQQSENIIRATGLLHELIHTFADARAKAYAIKEVEHAGDQITHEIVRRLNTTFITPIDREDIHDLATRLDDVLDFLEAAAQRLVIYRIKEPTSACRAMAEVIVAQVASMDRCIRCLRTMDPGFHEHAMEVNRLENRADTLLRETLAAMFEEQSDPIEVIKWKEIYETMEAVTDRCEDVANVIEGIILKMA